MKEVRRFHVLSFLTQKTTFKDNVNGLGCESDACRRWNWREKWIRKKVEVMIASKALKIVMTLAKCSRKNFTKKNFPSWVRFEPCNITRFQILTFSPDLLFIYFQETVNSSVLKLSLLSKLSTRLKLAKLTKFCNFLEKKIYIRIFFWKILSVQFNSTAAF